MTAFAPIRMIHKVPKRPQSRVVRQHQDRPRSLSRYLHPHSGCRRKCLHRPHWLACHHHCRQKDCRCRHRHRADPRPFSQRVHHCPWHRRSCRLRCHPACRHPGCRHGNRRRCPATEHSSCTTGIKNPVTEQPTNIRHAAQERLCTDVAAHLTGGDEQVERLTVAVTNNVQPDVLAAIGATNVPGYFLCKQSAGQ